MTSGHTVANDLINIILGLGVLLSYVIILPPAMKRMSADYLWAGIRGKARTLTVSSMLLTAIAYLYAYYHLRTEPSTTVTMGFVLFLVGALLWAPFLAKNNKIMTMGALTLTSIGALVLVFYTFYNFDSALLRAAVLHIFFHVFVLDNLHWGYKFLRNYNPRIGGV